jgi:hypothetical protein
MVNNLTIKTVVVQKGIPVTLLRSWSAVFSDMDIGDSFVVPSVSEAKAAHVCASRKGYRTCTRKLADGSCRVWRIG